jgi:hypothetical protein
VCKLDIATGTVNDVISNRGAIMTCSEPEPRPADNGVEVGTEAGTEVVAVADAEAEAEEVKAEVVDNTVLARSEVLFPVVGRSEFSVAA